MKMKTGIACAAVVSICLGALAQQERGPEPRPASPGGCPMMNREGGNPGMPGCPMMNREGANPGMAGSPMMMPPEMRAARAGATAIQVKALEDAMLDMQAKRIDHKAAVEKGELALTRLTRASTLDEKEIMKAADALNQARGELFKDELAMQIKMQQILGDEIFRKMREQGPCEGGRPTPPPPPPGPQKAD